MMRNKKKNHQLNKYQPNYQFQADQLQQLSHQDKYSKTSSKNPLKIQVGHSHKLNLKNHSLKLTCLQILKISQRSQFKHLPLNK